MLKYFILFILFLMPISYGGTRDPGISDDKYIEYANEFPCVGCIIGFEKDDSPFRGSAVAYKSNIIITAAHMFENHKSSIVIFKNKKLLIKEIIIHKDYKKSPNPINDIAVCLVDGDIGLITYPNLYIENNEKGKVCSLSGFGCSGTFLTGITDRRAIQRAGLNVIDSVDDFRIFCSPSVEFNKTQLEFLIAHGDSGGGLFIDNKLAGIHSAISDIEKNEGQSKYGSSSWHTRISSYKDWINKAIDQLTINNK